MNKRKGDETVMIQSISAHDFAQQYQKNQWTDEQIIDVREQEEWDIYHLENSRLIPLNTLSQQVHALSTCQDLYILCAHGVRSAYAVNWLQAYGFTHVYNVEGGLAEVSLHLHDET